MTKIIQLIIVGVVLCFTGSLHAQKLTPSSDQICLAQVVYHEAGNQPFLGKEAVAEVIINRVHHGFANSVCAVVQQRVGGHWQFGSYTIGKNIIPLSRREYFYRISALVMTSEVHYLPDNVLYFNNTLFDKTHYDVYKKIGQQYFFIRRKAR